MCSLPLAHVLASARTATADEMAVPSESKQTCLTPLSEASTAPGTPCFKFILPDLDDDSDDNPALVATASRRPRHLRKAQIGKAIRAVKEAQASPRPLFPEGTETLLFVDIDGVLNVGVGDGHAHPISLDKENLEKLANMQSTIPEERQSSTIKIMAAVCSHTADGDDVTYGEICKGASGVVDIFVKRLAKIIQAAGPSRTVVLSSTWRLPQNVAKLRVLEKILSQSLGAPFTFGVKTALKEHESPAGRLQNIADFLAEHCAQKAKECRLLRVLVLEDFHLHSLGSWSCDGKVMTSEQEVEMFLAERVPQHIASSVKLIHTYDEWTMRNGTIVQVGSGLTLKHFDNAMQFLSTEVGQPEKPSIDMPKSQWSRSVTEPIGASLLSNEETLSDDDADLD